MSKIIGLCQECERALLQDFAAGGWVYASCMGGHAWRVKNGTVEARPYEPEADPPPVQQVIPANQWEATIPEQPDAFKWCYQQTGG